MPMSLPVPDGGTDPIPPKRITVTIDGLDPIVFDANEFDVALTDSRLELVAKRATPVFAGWRITFP